MVEINLITGHLDTRYADVTIRMPNHVWETLQERGITEYDILADGVPEEFDGEVEIDEIEYVSSYLD